MKTVNLEQYADPDVLREFSPRMLVALLDEDRPFPVGKGVNRVRANASGKHLKPSNVRSHSADEAGAVNQRSGRKGPCVRR
jgi:hypothetical protein